MLYLRSQIAPIVVSLTLATQSTLAIRCFAEETSAPCVSVVHREMTEQSSPYYGAIYADADSNRLVSTAWQSDDNGASWQPIRSHHALAKGLPAGYRRSPVTAVLDEKRNCVISVVNAMDTPNLDPTINEPPIAQETYYLRYRLSTDGERTWLCDDPIVSKGKFDAKHPFADISLGKNAIFLGDKGCAPIVTRSGRVLAPVQMTTLDKSGKLRKGPKGTTYTEAAVLVGVWNENDRLTWHMSERVQGDTSQTVRGLVEPTIVESPDGRIWMVMRGSNLHDPQVIASKWFSISEDQGETWTKPRRWGYDDGTSFYSPSSMSVLLRHSSGRIFWVGNITPKNAFGNLPRNPLVIGEVDPQSLHLIRSSMI
ncbi:MAG: sialidase family protein, partial [Blastopirellula sp. JB062]